MDAYIYQAALYCEECAEEIRGELIDAGIGESDDSETWPQGPFADGGGEADVPQHCDRCREFLANPLTSDGFDYVLAKVADFVSRPGAGNPDVIHAWIDYYGITLEAVIERACAVHRDR